MQMPVTLARSLAWFLLWGVSCVSFAQQPEPAASPSWQALRVRLFQQRPIHTESSIITLDAPVRAADAALVPIAVKAQFGQSATRRIERLWLIIDNNPAPLAAVIRFGPASARADLATRVRIDSYTFVRAVAQTQDGQLHMATRYVKASGGCSAPPSKDAEAARASLGRMRLRVQPPLHPGEPRAAQLMISHPNHSGLAMDQLTRHYEPAHFVRSVEVSYQGRPVLSADLDISISENPNLRFYFTAGQEGGLRAEVLDSKEQRFDATLDLAQGGS